MKPALSEYLEPPSVDEPLIKAVQYPQIKSAQSLVLKKPPLPAELVCGLIHRGTKVSLGGASKARKSWCQIDKAVSVASGEPWLGIETKKAKVIYINLEILEPFFARRVESVCSGKGIKVPSDLDVWTLRGYRVEFDSFVRELLARTADYSLIIFDPIYKLYGSTFGENDAGDVANLLFALDTVCNETGAAVAYGAHFSKGNQSGKDAIDRVSGSGTFARDPDTLLNLTAHKEEDAYAFEATLRNCPPLEPFVVRWEYPLFRRDDNLDPSDLRAPKNSRSEPDLKLVQDCCGDGSLSKARLAKTICEEAGCSRSTAYAWIGKAERTKKITLSKINGEFMRNE